MATAGGVVETGQVAVSPHPEGTRERRTTGPSSPSGQGWSQSWGCDTFITNCLRALRRTKGTAGDHVDTMLMVRTLGRGSVGDRGLQSEILSTLDQTGD